MHYEISKQDVDTCHLPEEFRDYVTGLLRTNPSSIFELSREARILLLYTLSDNDTFSIYPDDILSGVFGFCCGMTKECASLAEEAIDADIRTWSSHLYHALLVLGVLDSPRMQCIGCGDDQCFAPPSLQEHWVELFFGVKTLHRASRARDSQMGTQNARLVAAQFSAVLFKFLRNRAVLSSFRNDVELMKFVWTLWLSNGVLDSGDLDLACGSTSTVLMYLFSIPMEGKIPTGSAVMFPICMATCDEFGGRDAVAEIALMSVYQTMMSNDKKLIMELLPQNIAILTMLAGCAVDPMRQIAKRIYELDGIAKLIEVAVNILIYAPEEERYLNLLDTMMASLITLIERLATENYILMAHAMKSGLLRIPLTVQKSHSAVLDSTYEATSILIDAISLFVSYHSVIGALADQLRSLTEEEEACMLGDVEEGSIKLAWNNMKRYFVGSYIVMRKFDICLMPFPKCCNNCAYPEAQHSFLQCARCTCVFYCSAECLETDLKAGKHLESCQILCGTEGPGSQDISYLYFLANRQIWSGYKELLAPAMSPTEGTIFVLDATETRNQDTINILPNDTAYAELHERRKRASDSYRIIDQRPTIPLKKANGEPVHYIQAMHRESRERCVVRYIPIDSDPQRFEMAYGSPKGEYEILREIINDVKVRYPGADLKKSWTLSDWDGERIHLFDEVDAYFRNEFRK